MLLPRHLVLVSPKNFGFNEQTAASNKFQSVIKIDKLQERVLTEWNNVGKALSDNEIAYTAFEPPKNKIVPDALFPNNWFATLPTGDLIIFPMMAQNRRDEINEEIISWIADKFIVKNLIDLRSYASRGIFLEGTGSIVIDHKLRTIYGCISPRTDEQLLIELGDLKNYISYPFAASDRNDNPIYHTNVMMSIGQNVAVVCLEAIKHAPTRELIKERISQFGRPVIDISFAQMEAFCANILEVKNTNGESIWLMSERAATNFTPLQMSELSRHSRIVTVNIDTIERVGGGGFRCLLAGIHLQKK